MNKHKLFGYAMRAIDDDFSGESSDTDAELQALLDELIEKPDAEPAHEEPRPITSVDLDALLEEKFAKLQASMRPAEPEKPAPVAAAPVAGSDPLAIFRRLQDIQDGIFKDIREIYPDMPDEAVGMIRADLNGFTTIEQLEAAKSQKYHHRIADSIMGALTRQNKYVPSQFKNAPDTSGGSVSGGARPATKPLELSNEDRDVLAQVNAVIAQHIPGGKLDADDFDSAQKHLKRVGRGEMVRV